MATAQPITSWSAGTLVARADGLSAPRMLKRRFADVVSFLDATGSARDGGDTGSAFQGTDNTTPMRAALAHIADVRKTLLVPPGKYRFADLAANNFTLDGDTYTIQAHGAEFLIDDQGLMTSGEFANIAPAVAGSALFGSTVTTNREAKARLCIIGATFRGRWSHFDLNTWNGNGLRRVIIAYGFAEFILEQCRFIDITSQAINCFSFGSARVTNCSWERIARASLRINDTPDQFIGYNRFRYVGDDFINSSAAISGNPGTTPSEIRGRLSIVGNSAFMCQTMLVQGGRFINVIGNNLKYMASAGIRIGSTVGLPKTTPYSINVIGNNVENTITGESATFGELVDADDGNAGITVDGVQTSEDTTVAVPGFSDGTTVVDPRGLDDNGDYLINAQDASRFAGFGFNIAHNNVHQTKAPGTNFSDFGEGLYFSGRGFSDPVMNINKLARHGITLVMDVRGAIIANNNVSGHRMGAGICYDFSNSPDNARTFRNILSTGNNLRDNREGISTNRRGTGTAVNVDIRSFNDQVDCDPYLKSARRNGLDGTWLSGTAAGDIVAAINTRGTIGFVIRGLVAQNCLEPIATHGSEPQTFADIRGCIAFCDPVATGFSTSNKGIGTVPVASEAWTHKIMHCDATDAANFGLLKNLCPVQASVQPSTGTFVAGHFVRNVNPSATTRGWRRLTTGTGHAEEIDWAEEFYARGTSSASVTATVDGTGTGVIPETATYVQVTSADPDHKVTLPSGGGAHLGRQPLLIWVGDNGFEMLGGAGTPRINDLNVAGGSRQVDIPPNTLSRLTLATTQEWILESLTSLGAVNPPLVADDD